jgi:hypothetical protein
MDEDEQYELDSAWGHQQELECMSLETCEGCGCEIDPNFCHCGEAIQSHNAYWSGHSPVPAGCQCGREPVDSPDESQETSMTFHDDIDNMIHAPGIKPEEYAAAAYRQAFDDPQEFDEFDEEIESDKQRAAASFRASEDAKITAVLTHPDDVVLLDWVSMGVPVILKLPKDHWLAEGVDPSPLAPYSLYDDNAGLECIYCGELGCKRVDLHGPEYDAQQEVEEYEEAARKVRWQTGRLNADERNSEITRIMQYYIEEEQRVVAADFEATRDIMQDLAEHQVNQGILSAVTFIFSLVATVFAVISWWHR